jgi:5'-deoxynucleotidase YfbR-like HD superfamily hydrolase
MAALAHDLAEHVVGDVPAPAKRSLGIGKLYEAAEQRCLDDAGIGHYSNNLSPWEYDILKLADCFEGMIFCLRERKFGNRNVDVIFGRYTSYVAEVVSKMTALPEKMRAIQLLEDLNKEWKEIQ